ncbi:hypothetical protein [Microbacterium sp.]|uniref:hypothetical protein n=1 Tax=Microbacterium sp. TaxID=51671 RepID=UPI00281108F2|nr:hypothetical protein [Microbacterium sp.]
MSEQQPDVRWAPIPPKPRNRGRVWLIVGLSVAAVIIVALLLFFLIPRDDGQPVGTPTPTASSSATQIPTPTPTPTPGTTTAPEPNPVDTPPPPADPDLAFFRGQVQPWLDDALAGLDFVADSDDSEALTIIDTLQGDAQRLGGTQPPSAIETEWQDGVAAYAASLEDLREAASAGDSLSVGDSRTRANALRNLVGL